MHLPHAARDVGGGATLRLPGMQESDRVLRQYAGAELAHFARAVPALQDSNLSKISRDRVADGLHVSCVLLVLRLEPVHCKVLRVFIPSFGTNLH